MAKKNTIIYSNHAVQQMFQRKISIKEVEYIIQNGEIIKNYPKDKPYPSKLILGFYNNRPLHLVISYNRNDNLFIIITAYEPNSEIWNENFKTRKK